MATLRYLISRAASKNLPPSLHFQTRFLTTLSQFTSPHHRNPRSSSSARSYSQDSDQSIAASLNVDHRIPATIITGFLGSGKVLLWRFSLFLEG
ncbi:unnamed protein product [Cuscuta campestris]|uniref:CobW/HypB/UreG nucleotide-binding domain-containing protein n=1 Tax=Cuscuta campestris TaxID=132261 RepID=A0A484L3K1_9ASTE|nr:unnamed protein product [Cuscuta campestris]